MRKNQKTTVEDVLFSVFYLRWINVFSFKPNEEEETAI